MMFCLAHVFFSVLYENLVSRVIRGLDKSTAERHSFQVSDSDDSTVGYCTHQALKTGAEDRRSSLIHRAADDSTVRLGACIPIYFITPTSKFYTDSL